MSCLGLTVEHEVNSGDVDERFRRLHFEFVIFAQPAVTTEPSETPLDDPGQTRDLERVLSAFDNLKLPAVLFQELPSELPALVAGIGNDGANVGEQRAQPAEQQTGGSPIRGIGRLDSTCNGPPDVSTRM